MRHGEDGDAGTRDTGKAETLRRLPLKARSLLVSSMRIDVSEQPAIDLDEYASIPVAFEVSTVLDVAEGQHPGTFILTERCLEFLFTKDYDAIPGNSPFHWVKRFDISSWGFLSASRRRACWWRGDRVEGSRR